MQKVVGNELPRGRTEPGLARRADGSVSHGEERFPFICNTWQRPAKFLNSKRIHLFSTASLSALKSSHVGNGISFSAYDIKLNGSCDAEFLDEEGGSDKTASDSRRMLLVPRHR